ncbi:DUF7927 domain-containing protein [Leucobacter sp. HY1908]
MSGVPAGAMAFAPPPLVAADAGASSDAEEELAQDDSELQTPDSGTDPSTGSGGEEHANPTDEGTREESMKLVDEAASTSKADGENDADEDEDTDAARDVFSPGGIIGYGLVNSGTPKTDYSGSSIAGTALQTGTWAAYVAAGDNLVVDLVTPDDGYQAPGVSAANGGPQIKGFDLTPLKVEIVRPDGTTAHTATAVKEAGKQLGQTFTGIDAAHAGVWKIRIIGGTSSDNREHAELDPRLKWNIYVPGKAGSVWTSQLNIGQNWKNTEGPGATPIDVWAINQGGKQYKVSAPHYNGIHSTFVMNNLGVVHSDKADDGLCVRAPLSVAMRNSPETMLNGKQGTAYRGPASTGVGENQCPNLRPFKMFTKPPHPSLPADAAGYGWVKPAYVAPSFSNMSLNRSTGVLTGTITGQDMDLVVKIGAKGSQADGYDGTAVTTRVTVTPGTNKQVLQWDRKDSTGAVVPFSKDLKVTVTGDGASYIHFTRADAEHSNGGVIITDLQTNQVTPVSWDDSQLSQIAGRQSVGFTKTVTAGNGTDHKWDGTSVANKNDNTGSWGNSRVINDWASETFATTLELSPDDIIGPRLHVDKTQVGEPDYSSDRSSADVRWRVEVHNSGAAEALNTVMKDLYPAGAIEHTTIEPPTQGGFDAGSGVWDIGTLAPGATVSLTFSAVVPAGTTPEGVTHTNRAIVSATDLPRSETGDCQVNQSLDTDTDQCDEVQTEIEGAIPALKIDKEQLGEPVYAADRKTARVTWKVTVLSAGEAPAQQVEVKDVYPTGSASPQQLESPSHGTFDAEAGTWEIGTLNSGDIATLTLSAVIPTAGAFETATHINRAIVTATGLPRPETGDCQVNAGIEADTDQCDEVETKLDGPKPGWSMAKDSDPKSGAEVAAGNPITYTLTVRNTGNVPLTGISLVDTLAKVTPYAQLDGIPQERVSGAQSVARPNAISGDKLAWTAPTLPAGAEATLTYTYRLNQDAWGITVDNAVFGTVTYGDTPLLPDSCGESAEKPCATGHSTPAPPRNDPPRNEPPRNDLPVTGGPQAAAVILGGGGMLLIAAGIGLIVLRRRQR